MPDELVRGINHVSLLVDDLDQAERFVTAVLGFRHDRRVDDDERRITLAFFRSGSALLELVWLHDEPQRRERLGGAAALIDHVAFDVADAGAAAEALAQAGVEFHEPFAAPDAEEPEAAVRASHRNPNATIFFTRPATSIGVTLQFIQGETRPLP
jgi:catechol 2,3-dioxygenase-like lactoylglutathione lyase family enzyme